MSGGYPVPTATPGNLHVTEQIIRRSRFLAQGSYCASREEAKEIVACIRQRYPDATHHCWAYAAGPPGSTARIGSSDDGEPHGTAGRPMLTALLHCGIGQICVVISRWFGGIKLGTGGLSRAYRDGTAENAATMPVTIVESRGGWRLDCTYGDLAAIKRVLEPMGVSWQRETFAEGVTIFLTAPASQAELLVAAVAQASAGRAVLAPTEMADM